MLKDQRLFLSFVLLLAAAAPVRASYHFMRISEAMAQFRGDPRLQFVELQMTSGAQRFVGGHRIIFQDAAGNTTGEATFASDVINGLDNDNILIGTAAFAAAFNVAVDLVMPEGLMTPYSGRVCFDPPPNAEIDCLAYGDYTGSTDGLGTPAPRFPVDGALSLTLKNPDPPEPGPGRDNSADYEFRDPTPRNNMRQTGSAPPASCSLIENFTNTDRLDQPAAGAGLDMSSCGADIVADIGFVDVVGNKLILNPGQRNDLAGAGIPVPICLTGLNNVTAGTITDKNYRLKLNMLAHQGIVFGAFFTRQRYLFDDVSSIIDVSQGSGFGINFTVDSPDEVSDHFHADIRLACLDDSLGPDGEDQFDYPGDRLMQSGILHTIILDIDGDDEAGPITLQVKIFPAVDPEPIDYLGTFKVEAGLGAVQDAALEHEFLAAALGPPGSSMELSDLSICRIPRNQKHVRCLSCSRQDDGTVLVTWQNPSDAETATPTKIAVNGGPAEMVPGTATEHTIAEPPGGELTIAVTNYAGISQTCTVCGNNPPVVVIAGPTTAQLQGGTVTIALDSSNSTDGDNGSQALTRLWEIIAAPPGGNASLDDPGAMVVNVNMNADGEYRIRLTLTDTGCEPGSPIPASESAEHTIRVGAQPQGGRQKPQDFNQDARLDLSDTVALLGFLFLGGPAPPCGDRSSTHAANVRLLDCNGDGKIDISDAICVLGFLFLGGSRPPACVDNTCPCIAIVDCPDRCP